MIITRKKTLTDRVRSCSSIHSNRSPVRLGYIWTLKSISISSYTAQQKKKKKYYIVSFKNVCKKHKVSRVSTTGIICSVRLLCALQVLGRSEVRYYLALLFTVPSLSVLLPHLFLSASSTSHFLLDFSLRHPSCEKKRRGGGASLLESRRWSDSRTDPWLLSPPACRVLLGLKWRSNVNFTCVF